MTPNDKKPDHRTKMQALAQAAMGQAVPPCDGCEFRLKCFSGERCLPFRQYIDSGRFLPRAKRTPNLVIQLIQVVASG